MKNIEDNDLSMVSGGKGNVKITVIKDCPLKMAKMNILCLKSHCCFAFKYSNGYVCSKQQNQNLEEGKPVTIPLPLPDEEFI